MATETHVQARPATMSSIPGAAGAWYQDVAEHGITEACDRIAIAWSDGDIPALAASLAPDCDHMTLTRVRQVKHGRDEILGSWMEAFSRRSPDFSLRMTVNLQSVRIIRDDLALVDGTLEYSGGIGAAGVTQGRSSQPFASVMVRTDGNWVILSLRVGAATAAPKVISFVESLLPR